MHCNPSNEYLLIGFNNETPMVFSLNNFQTFLKLDQH